MQLNNFQNIEEGTVGRILSYYDLSDRKIMVADADDMDFTEFLEPAEQERLAEEERERLEREEREQEEEMNRQVEDIKRRRLEEEEEQERVRQASLSSEEKLREEERGGASPVTTEEIFRTVNRRRASMACVGGKKKGKETILQLSELVQSSQFFKLKIAIIGSTQKSHNYWYCATESPLGVKTFA